MDTSRAPAGGRTRAQDRQRRVAEILRYPSLAPPTDTGPQFYDQASTKAYTPDVLARVMLDSSRSLVPVQDEFSHLQDEIPSGVESHAVTRPTQSSLPDAHAWITVPSQHPGRQRAAVFAALLIATVGALCRVRALELGKVERESHRRGSSNRSPDGNRSR